MSRPITYKVDPVHPFGIVLDAAILITGPVYRGYFISSSIPALYSGDGHRTIFSYFIGDGHRTIFSYFTGDGKRKVSLKDAKDLGIGFTLDAQDDVPPDGSKGLLLEMGQYHSGITIYLVLVQTHLPDRGGARKCRYYRRIGLSVYLNTRGEMQGATAQREAYRRYKFMSAYPVTPVSLGQAQIKSLYLV